MHTQLRRRQPDESFEAWFFSNVTVNDNGCWIWIGAKRRGGYGVVWLNGENRPSHVVAYALRNGPVPDGMVVCHKCDTPPCMNPDHLFTGTHADNTNDAVSKDRMARGEKHGNAILTWAIVRAVRVDYDTGTYTIIALSLKHGLSWSTAYNVAKRISWKERT
jgi:hypothetical protein